MVRWSGGKSGQGGHPGWFVRVPPYEISVFLMNYRYLNSYTQICDRGAPPGVNRVKVQNNVEEQFFSSIIPFKGVKRCAQRSIYGVQQLFEKPQFQDLCLG